MNGNTQRTFTEWKTEVMKILPRRAQEEAGAMARLEALVTKWARDPITRHDRSAFFDFSLGFSAEAAAIKGAISNRELVRMYLRCLTPVFRERLQEKLVPGTGRSEEDPYLWTDVVAQATSIVTGGTTGPFGDLGLEPSVNDYPRIKIEARDVPLGGSRTIENIKVKQEEMESNFQTLCGKMDVMSVQLKEVLNKHENNTSMNTPIFQQGIVPAQPRQSSYTQRPRQGMYTRPPNNPFNTPPHICYYCNVEGHMLMACPTLDADKASGRVVQQGYNIYVKNRQLSKESPDGLSMKQRADAILAGTYNPPAMIQMLTAEDWGQVEENTMVFFQSEPDTVSSAVLQQTVERLRAETQGAMQGMANHIIASLKPPPVSLPPVVHSTYSPYANAPPADHSASVPATEVRDMFQLLTKRLDGLEQYQIQTRSQAPANEGFRVTPEDRENVLRVLSEVFNSTHPIKFVDLVRMSPRARALATELLRKNKLIRDADGTLPLLEAMIEEHGEISRALGVSEQDVELELVNLLGANPKPEVPGLDEGLEVFIQDLVVPEHYYSSGSEDVPKGALVCPDPIESFLIENSGATVKGLVVAASSAKIRTFFPVVNRCREEETIIDEGSQVCSASEATAVALGIAWDPAMRIGLQSSNKTTSTTLGLARNVPIHCGNNVVAYVQLHIVQTAAYKMLLGRPFLSAMSAVSASKPDGTHTLTLTDPNNEGQVTIPTYPRGEIPAQYRDRLTTAFQTSMI
ncbi:hypothetical protein DFP72DRAFT_1084366 [Ephemerocybe angulata]|uniref:CCHC-type domain-containing protein n=1 Tax=Ephemerocybe angulata TaxID=980116 RepID=A0A8H6H8U2_9AGAR|nr:hypothetical protein DFP72DRAFT_1084366 [Tulosesus angulatus]